MLSLGLTAALCLGQVAAEQPGTWGDPSRAVFTEPSARSVLSGVNAVSFDGLAPSTSRFDFDGVEVLMPAHVLLGPSAVSAAWTPCVGVGSGLGDVATGRALGRRLTLFTREAPPADTTRTVLRLDLLHAGVFVERGLSDGSHFEGAARFFTTPAAAGLLLKGSVLLGDHQLRWVQRLGEGELRTVLLGGWNSVALTVAGIPLGVGLQSHQLDVRWRLGGLELGAGAHRSTLGLTLRGDAVTNALEGAQDAVNARVRFSRVLSANAHARVGADVEVRRLSLLRETTLREAAVGQRRLGELGVVAVGGAFAEATVQEGAWHTMLGVRADVWSPAGGPALLTADPRVTTRRSIGNASLELGAGLLHQAPTWLMTAPLLESLALGAGLQELARVDATARLPLGTAPGDFAQAHLFAGYLTRAIEFSPFDDDFLQLVNQVPADVDRHRSTGWVGGGELRGRFSPTPRLQVEASYGFQQSWRRAQFERFGLDGLPVGDGVAWVPWQHQQTHQLRAATAWTPGGGWRLAVAATVTSGAPLVGGLVSREQQPGVDSLTGAPRWAPKDRDAVSTAGAFLRADVRVSKTWRPASAEVEVFLDVANLGLAQPTGTSYGVAPATLEQQARGEVTLTSKAAASPLPPIPVLGVEVRL